MVTRLQRFLPSLLLDALVLLAFVFPEICAYLRWPLLGLYGALSWLLLRRLSEHSWILTIVRDRRTRIVHGLEHATLAVLYEAGLPALHGFTHGRDRFMVALKSQGAPAIAVVRDAVLASVRRIRDGERKLAYQTGCGTSEVVSAVTLWLVYVSSMLFSLLVGGAVPIFFAVSVIAFRFWLACDTSLGLLAQRLFTVSTELASAQVVDVRVTERIGAHVPPDHETWFEIVVDFQIGASRGGLVVPGPLA